MTFKRHDIEERYQITVPWLKEFARKMEKKSYNIENLKNIRQMVNTSNKFATIEEKMEDIKARIGFDMIKKMHDDRPESKTANKKCQCTTEKSGCSCNIKTAKQEHSEEHLSAMNNILKYIQDLCRYEHDRLSTMMVISRCREEPGLDFDNLPINMDKLKDFIEESLDKYSDNKSEEVSYIPRDEESLDRADKNLEAEYWNHAFPERG